MPWSLDLKNNKRVDIGIKETDSEANPRDATISLVCRDSNMILWKLTPRTKKLVPKDLMWKCEFQSLPHYEIIEICDLYNEFVKENGCSEDVLDISSMYWGSFGSLKNLQDGQIIECWGKKFRLTEIE